MDDPNDLTSKKSVVTHEAIALGHALVTVMEKFTVTDDIKLAALKIAKATVKTGSDFKRTLLENK